MKNCQLFRINSYLQRKINLEAAICLWYGNLIAHELKELAIAPDSKLWIKFEVTYSDFEMLQKLVSKSQEEVICKVWAKFYMKYVWNCDRPKITNFAMIQIRK